MRMCSRCGSELPDTAKFCTRCGSRIEDVKPVTPVAEAPTPVVETPTPVVETPTPVVETPTPVVEAPAPVVEAPAPAVEAPAVEAPAPVVPVPEATASAVTVMSKKEAKRMAKETKKAAATVVPVPPPAPVTAPVVGMSKNQQSRSAHVEKASEVSAVVTKKDSNIFGTIAGVFFSIFLVVCLVFAYISSAAAGLFSSDVSDFGITVDGNEYSVSDVVYVTRQFEEGDTRMLVEALVKNGGSYQIKVGTKIYDARFDGQTLSLIENTVLTEEGLSSSILSSIESVSGTASLFTIIILAVLLIASIATTVAIIFCFGKKKVGYLIPAAILLLVAILGVVLSLMGSDLFAGQMFGEIFAIEQVFMFSVIASAVMAVSGIAVCVLAFVGKKKA